MKFTAIVQWLRCVVFLSMICLVGSPLVTKAQVSGVLTVDDILSKQITFFTDLNSIQFSEETGDPAGNAYQKITLKECGNMYYFDYDNRNKPAKQNVKLSVSYDGEHGFEYIPVNDIMYIQKKPFDRDDSYLGSVRGPLYAFEYMQTRGTSFKLKDLKSPEFYKSAVKRASVVQAGNATWAGHPCILVKVANGFNRILNQDVDYEVFFSLDNNLYPIAWRALSKDDGQVLISYWVTHFDTIDINGAKSVFRYPSKSVYRYEQGLAKAGYKYPPNVSPDSVSFSNDRADNVSAVEINHLRDEDFSMDPTMVSNIVDLDTNVGIVVPK